MKFVLILLAFVAVINCERVVFKRKPSTKVADGNSDWWKTARFYQIYPRSFKDNTNDGYGDLAGIIEKLPYLAATNITAVWLSPIFASPQVDQGYDISDYRTVDPVYGTNDDLKELVEKAHELGLKIILDFVPNHTSDQHEWFLKSVNKTEGYEDYYIWENGTVDNDGTRHPPNNWISLFKGSAWEWNENRQQYYLHQFASAQPDLNYRNKKVVQELNDILTFWLDFGVDGFRVDAVPFLAEIETFEDEPLSGAEGYGPNDYEYLDHPYTKDQNLTYEIIYGWRDLLDNYTLVKGGDQRIMMTEAYTTFEKTLLYFGSPELGRNGAHFSFNFDFVTLSKEGTDNETVATNVYDICVKWAEASNKNNSIIVQNWVLGNHDNHRVATRFGPDTVDGFNMLTALLPGIQVTYNGEEIGQEDGEVTCEQGHDPQAIKNCSIFDQVSRDFERTPFQWDSSINAGFNDGATPWLPVSKKANETNLKLQNVEGLNSHYNNYVGLSNIRKTIREAEAIADIFIDSVGITNNNIIDIERSYMIGDTYSTYQLLFNLSENEEIITIYSLGGDGPTVEFKSLNSNKTIGAIIDVETVLKPYEAIVLKQAAQLTTAQETKNGNS